MKPCTIVGAFGLVLACEASHGAAALPFNQASRAELTPSPAGPFRVAGNKVIDFKGNAFVIRGTELPEFQPQTAGRDARPGDFGPYSGTSLSAIRLRFNMNAVRLPVNINDGGRPGFFSKLGEVVRAANHYNLLVILAAHEPGARLPSRTSAGFWSRCAAFFKDYPNVIFDVFADPSPSAVPANAGNPHSPSGWNFWRKGGRAADGRDVIGMEDLVHAIRSSGAAQPVVVTSWNDDRLFEGAEHLALLNDPNIIYGASPRYGRTRTDRERNARFGFLAERSPLLTNGWDPKLEDAAACATIPSDPTAANQLLEESLRYFDAHQISWTVSVYRPGKLISDFNLQEPTSLENGWTCGKRYQPAGVGRLVEAHLRATRERGLFVVSPSGSLDVARGSSAIAYGPIMAERDSRADGKSLPLSLGKVSVEVTDARGVTRPAGLQWASAGWGQVDFVVPAESAPGPGHLTISRVDGSRASANLVIADTAPGFWTGVSCRGPALGSITQVFADGRKSTSPLSECKGSNCRALPVQVTDRATTQVRLLGSGYRYAGSAANIEVTVGGKPVRVVSFGPAGDPGMDQLTIEIPAGLGGLGEADLTSRVSGRVSNAVQIRIGGEKPAS